MKTRREAVELVSRQLGGPFSEKTVLYLREKGHAWHYGKQDLRELLDFIYEGPPADDSERIE